VTGGASMALRPVGDTACSGVATSGIDDDDCAHDGEVRFRTAVL
jgi:hypothetical protein